MKKPSLALLVSSLSALSYQASADSVINIEEEKVSDDLATFLQSHFYHAEPNNIINENFISFCDSINIDGEELDIDVQAYLTSGDPDDSTTSKNKQKSHKTLNSCYTNCYNNCHGSRGWR